MKQQKKKRSDSTNFHTNLATFLGQVGAILAVAFSANGIENVPDISALIVQTLDTGVILPLLMALPNITTPAIKIFAKFKDGNFSWDFLKSTNFLTQAVTALGGALIAFTPVPADYVLAIVATLNAANLAYHIHIKKP